MEIRFKDNSPTFSDVSVKEGIVSGYFSSFDDTPDSDNDIVLKGAYIKTIKENGPLGTKGIKHLLDHDFKKGIGKFLELHEDAKGLAYVSKLGTNFHAIDALKMIESEIITEHSIGYSIIKQHKGPEGWNYLSEIKLWEGSCLQGPGANRNTPITSLKSNEELLSLFVKLDKALHSGTYTDETMLKLQEQYDIISKYFKTTQPSAPISETTVPSERKEDQAKGFDPEAISKHFKTALENGRGASKSAS